jgi:glycyl-tRNA synthetase beta subunit
VQRVEALGKFLDSDDGRNLLAGYKRATNIIRIEEKKDKTPYTGAPDTKLLQQDEEKALAQAIGVAMNEAGAALVKEDFAAAMSAMAKLRPAVDAFSTRSPSMPTTRRCAKTASSCSTRSARRRARLRIFRKSRGDSFSLHR